MEWNFIGFFISCTLFYDPYWLLWFRWTERAVEELFLAQERSWYSIVELRMSVDNACAVRGERRVMKQLVCGLARPAHPGLSPGNLNLRLTYKMEAYWAATSIFIEIIYLWRRSPGGCRCVPDSSPEIDQRHIVMCAFSAYLYKYFAFYLPCIIIISVIYGRTFTHMAPHPAALLSLWQNFRPAAPPAVPHPPPPRLYFSNHLSDFVLHHLHLVSQLVGHFLREV